MKWVLLSSCWSVSAGLLSTAHRALHSSSRKDRCATLEDREDVLKPWPHDRPVIAFDDDQAQLLSGKYGRSLQPRPLSDENHRTQLRPPARPHLAAAVCGGV